MGLKNFENVKDQVGACGLWCGSCVVGNGALAELAGRYRALVDSYGLKDWGARNFDYQEFTKALDSIQALPSCPGCLKGGGRDDCEIRACAAGKGLEDCVECGRMQDCDFHEIIERMRSGGKTAGMTIKAAAGEAPFEQWIEQLKAGWPCSILFEDER